MTEARDARWRPLAALLAGACVLGLSPILVRLTETGPAAAGFWRLAFGLPWLALIAARSEGIGAPSRFSALAGLFFALDLGFWHYSIRLTSVANATVLSNLAPVVVTAVAWIFLGQRPRALFLIALAAAVGGAWTMALGKAAPGLRDQPLGDALGALTSVWYAFYFLALGAGRARESASRLMVWSSLVGAPLMIAAALLLGERLVPLSAAGWAACVGLGVMHVAGQGTVAWALGRLPAQTASVVVLVQPIVAAALGWTLFGEHIGALQGLGAAITLGGVVLAQWAARSKG